MPRTTEVTEAERLRRRAGFSVTKFARVIGYSHTMVSLIEGGRLKPSKRYRAAVSRALKVPEHLLWP